MVATTRSEPSALVVRTFEETPGRYPTEARKFYACRTEDGRVVYAANAGGKVPPIGTGVMVHRINERWVFTYHGTSR